MLRVFKTQWRRTATSLNIRLYADFTVLEIQRPGDSCGKNKDELLIFSHDIDAVLGTEDTLNAEQLLMDTMMYQRMKGGEHFGRSI